ncbi:MAG: carbohydrate kinase family protein, partial [Armatimonadetes bacterium]|nr:carbohydrate kinase family protein [Armatimonadota bacterium]
MVVTILGGTTMDVFVSGLPRLPQMDPAGDEFTVTSLVEVPRPPVFTIGGNGANAGCVLATLGCQVRLVTSLGADLPG